MKVMVGGFWGKSTQLRGEVRRHQRHSFSFESHCVWLVLHRVCIVQYNTEYLRTYGFNEPDLVKCLSYGFYTGKVMVCDAIILNTFFPRPAARTTPTP